MPNCHKSAAVAFVSLVVLSCWLVAPAMAGAGDPDQAKLAWPIIDSGALLIDVRSKEEFDKGHIDGAINIDWDNTNALMEAIGDDKQRPVVVYCRSGNRSGKAKFALDKKGYSGIFNATGLEDLPHGGGGEPVAEAG